MFALPAAAGSVDVDLMPAVDEFGGRTLGDVASRGIGSDLLLGFGTQLYPLAMIPFMEAASDQGPLPMDGGDYRADVDVAQHLESRGLTVEVVSTEHADALQTYLQDRGLHFEDAALSLIVEYIGLEYSFVVSWISDVYEFTMEVPRQFDPETQSYYYELGLFSTFPTDRVFYPMRLTSVYGETVVPMMLQVIGHVEPDEEGDDYGGLRMSVRHMVEDYYYVRSDLSVFFEGYGSGSILTDIDYTEVVITSPSEDLTADLWMVPASSTSLDIQYWLRDNTMFVAVAVIVGMSSLTGVVAGAIVFAHYRPVFWRFAALGLANLLTIVGLWIAIWASEPERTMVRSEIPAPPSPYRTDFLVLYTFIFVFSLGSLVMVLW